MAKKSNKNEERINYPALVRELKANGAERLYLLWGKEDYLREQYLLTLKRLCLPEGDDSFSFKRINGPTLDAAELEEAVNAIPFMTERSFVELRDVDINRVDKPESLLEILKDIPEYCTVAFVQDTELEPDGRLKFIKGLRQLGKEIRFTQQSQGMLTDWIVRRFAAAGKSIELEAAQRLVFISGDFMNRLIPEIEKVAAYTKGERVTVRDVEAVASHIPEAFIFEMTELIAQKKFNSAADVLAELLAEKDKEPIAILGALGAQMRKLYGAKLAVENGLGVKYVMDNCAIKYEFVANKLMNAAKGYKLSQLKRAVELCCEADHMMKSSSADDTELVKETAMRIMMGEDSAQC